MSGMVKLFNDTLLTNKTNTKKKITSSYQKWQCLQKRKMPNKKEKQRLMCEYNSSLCLIATGVTRNSLIGLMKINAFKLSAQTFIQIVY